MTGTGLNASRKSSVCLGRSWSHGGSEASTSHSQLGGLPSPFSMPLSVHLPTLSYLFMHSPPVPLCPCPRLCLPIVLQWCTYPPVAPLTPVPCLSAPDCPWHLVTLNVSISPHSVCPFLPHLPFSASLFFSPTLSFLPPPASLLQACSPTGHQQNRDR